MQIVQILPLLLIVFNCYQVTANCATGGCIQQVPQQNPCTSQVCSQNIELKISCDDNMILYFGRCVTLDVAQCPYSTVLIKGRCIEKSENCTGGSCIKDDKLKIICPYGSHLEVDKCVLDIPYYDVKCPSGYNKINGTCVYDGSCPVGTLTYNGQCYFNCPASSEFVNGTCIITVNSTWHGIVPHTVINNYTNIVNVTNILNHTNIYNIDTRANQTNENNIHLKSDSQFTNGGGSKSTKTHCCHIKEPTKCTEIKGKKVCYNRRKQVCGKECAGQEDEEDYADEDDNEYERPDTIVGPRPPHIVVVQNPPSIPPIMVHQPPLVRLPIIVQQPPIQRPQIIVQQPQIQRPQIIVQQPQIQRPQIIVQQPQIVRPQIIQQPQIISQPVVVQQPRVVVRQPQIISQPMIVHQQPQIVHQQPQVMQYVVQQPQTSHVIAGATPCAYQNMWPFVKCP